MTDYILYIHGSNVRTPDYANKMDLAVREAMPNDRVSAAVYWGDVSDAAEGRLLDQWQSSTLWKDMWFPELRSKMLLQLIGDSALYISRAFGASVVQRIFETVRDAFTGRSKGDRLHLVTHSWGAVIVLDVLFAPRWLEEKTPGREQILALRNGLFGLGDSPEEGLLLSSIITMGSPMSLFSLMDTDFGGHAESSHDISGNVKQYCRALFAETQTPLAWRNLIHPGDAFAYPSAPLLKSLLGADAYMADAQDQLVKIGPVGEFVQHTIGKTDLSAAAAANAHNSYWDAPPVIEDVITAIRGSADARTTVARST